MTPGENCYNLIKEWEKLRLTAFKPTPNDVWTIGWGHTKGVKEFDTCTIQKADEWLIEDTQEAANGVNHYVTAGINQNMYDALVSFTYNEGVGNLSTSHLLKYLNAGDFKAAAAEFDRFIYQKGKVLLGLVKRRAQERELFES